MNRTRRVRRWLWTWRWPGLPILLVGALTALLYAYRGSTKDGLDLAILVGITAMIAMMIASLILGTRDEWSERSTGILLFGVADLVLYGGFFLPPRLGLSNPWPDLSQAFLRANLIVGPPLLILSYSDWFWLRFRRWRRSRNMEGS